MELKDGIVLRPFGASSEIKGKVSKDVGEWLISKKLATKSDFKDAPKKTRKPKTPEQKAAASKKAKEIAAQKKLEATKSKIPADTAAKNQDKASAPVEKKDAKQTADTAK